MNLRIFAIMVVVTGLFLLGCDSKFVESSPGSVKINGLSLDERLTQKDKIDQKLAQVEQAADKIKRIIDMFRKIQDPNSKNDVYTPIDFILDLNSELEKKIPENGKDNSLVRYGKIELPLSSLEDECKVIQTMLVSSSIYSENQVSSEENNMVIGERLTYSFKSCGSNGKYLTAIEADWIGSTLEFRLNNENLEEMFNDVLVSELLKDSSCKITQDAKSIIETLSCESLSVTLSSSESALISELVFSNSGEIRFAAQAQIFENSIKKATSDIKVFSDGKVEFVLNKTAD